MEINPSAYEPMLKNASEQVFVRAFLDIRRQKKDGTFPIYIRVTYQGEKWLYATGVCMTDDDYAKALVVKNGSSPINKAKSQVTKAFNKVSKRPSPIRRKPRPRRSRHSLNTGKSSARARTPKRPACSTAPP